MQKTIVNDLDVDALTRLVAERRRSTPASASESPPAGPARPAARARSGRSSFGNGETVDRNFKIVADEPEEMLGGNRRPTRRSC